MSIFGAPSLFFGGADTGFYEFPVNHSLRFDDGSTSYLARTPSSTSNRQTWTFSAWVKRNNLGTQQFIWAATAASTDRSMIYFDADDTLRIYFRETGVNLGRGSGSSIGQASTAVFRDVSAWYHILVAFDSTQADASSPSRADANRLKFYVNGVQQTNDTSQTFANSAISQNANSAFNKVSIEHTLGIQGYDDGSAFDGYLAEVNFVDGLQLTPSSFAETKSGVWIPKAYTGVYGTNGFRLDFSDSTYQVKLGDDFDNLNNWTTDTTDSRQTSGAAFTTSNSNVTVSSYGTSNGSFHGPVVYNDLSSQNIDRFILRVRGLTVPNASSDLHSTIIQAIDTNDDGIVTFQFQDSHTNTGNNNNIYFNGGGTSVTVQSGTNLTLSSEFFEMERIGTNFVFRSTTGLNDQNVSGSARTNLKWVKFSHSQYQGLSTPNMTLDKIELIAYSSGFYQDKSGNNNDFVPYGLYGYSVTPDSPTLNYPTFQSTDLDPATLTLSEGNLKVANSTNNNYNTVSTMAMPNSGKWYAEFGFPTRAIGTGHLLQVGVVQASASAAENGNLSFLGTAGTNASGILMTDSSTVSDGYWVDAVLTYNFDAVVTPSTIISVAVDFDNGGFWAAINGTWVNNATLSEIVAGTTTNAAPVTSNADGWRFVVIPRNVSQLIANFGQDDSFLGNAISGSYSDDNGYGKFVYPVPSSYLSLNSANLPEPPISPLNDELPEDYFEPNIWTGNGTSQSISLYEFAPDWVWIKERTSTSSHMVQDTLRGTDVFIQTNSLIANTSNTNAITSFDSNGFTLGSGGSVNQSSQNYVGWAWLAGGPTPSQTYVVKVVSDSGNKYRFDDFGTSAVTLDLQEGGSYIFNMDDASNASHPFSIGTSANSTVYTSGITYFLDGVSKTYSQYTSGFASATTRRLHFTVPASAPVLYYWCSVHSGMGGQINTNALFGSSNFSGSIQSRVSANTEAGFSIVRYESTNSNATIGHGLNSAPEWVIFKRIETDGTNWAVFHKSIVNTKFLNLNTTAKETDSTSMFNSTSPTATVLSVGTSSHTNSSGSKDYIAYCFHPVESYSKFGSYKGNGDQNGTFVFTGFRPAFIIVKRSSDTSNASGWFLADKARNPFNLVDNKLAANRGDEENDPTYIGTSGANDFDFYSNGFKVRQTNDGTNKDGNTYIFMAFAEIPFKYANGR